MEEILKDMKLGQIIGVYHFEDSCFTVGKILKIDSKYLYLFSYDVNFKEDGIKIFLINSIKRIILKSDYMRSLEKNQKKIVRFNRENKDIFQELIKNRIKVSVELADGSVEEVYLIEKGEDYFSFQILNDNENITSEEIITKDYLKRIKISNYIEREEYTEIEVKLDTKKENFYELIDFEKDLEIVEILKKCLENKFLVFIDNIDFFETKVGVITNLEDNKIKMKEIDKYGDFYKNSEIYFDEIQLLAIKNYKIMERDYEKKI